MHSKMRSLSLLLAAAGFAQSPEPLNWTTEQDHRNMMEQLGIKALRPGPSGREGAPNPRTMTSLLRTLIRTCRMF